MGGVGGLVRGSTKSGGLVVTLVKFSWTNGSGKEVVRFRWALEAGPIELADGLEMGCERGAFRTEHLAEYPVRLVS